MAAQLGALGIDAVDFLYTRDSFRRNLIIELGKRIAKEKQVLDKNLASEIVNALGKAFKK